VRGGEFFERGLRPLSLLLPSPATRVFSFIYNGSGWRGVHPERFTLKGKG